MARDHRARADDRTAAGAARSHPRIERRTSTSGNGRRDRRLPRRSRRSCAQLPARRRRRAGDSRAGARVGRPARQAPVQIKGIDPGSSRRSPTSKRAMQSGSLEALATPPDGRPTAFCSATISRRKLGVAVGDSVSLLTPQGTLSPMGMMPRPRRLRVAGIFSLGLYEVDSTVRRSSSLDVAKRLLRQGSGRLHPAARRRHLSRRRQIARVDSGDSSAHEYSRAGLGAT